MIELDDADSMTVRHLNLIGGSTGLQVGKDSTNLGGRRSGDSQPDGRWRADRRRFDRALRSITLK
ncbi:MAG: hypothetical protein R3C99_00720 [Pirellulaceae bacterium]